MKMCVKCLHQHTHSLFFVTSLCEAGCRDFAVAILIAVARRKVKFGVLLFPKQIDSLGRQSVPPPHHCWLCWGVLLYSLATRTRKRTYF